MNITAFYTNSGIPSTGLSPTIDIWSVSDGSQDVDDGAMTELDGGWYKYDFTITNDSEHIWVIDSNDGTMSNFETYKYGSNFNDHTTQLDFIENMEGGRWLIDEDNDQMIFYGSDNVTEVARFNLKDQDGAASVLNVFERTRV
jgi:hypothetical protein